MDIGNLMKLLNDPRFHKFAVSYRSSLQCEAEFANVLEEGVMITVIREEGSLFIHIQCFFHREHFFVRT